MAQVVARSIERSVSFCVRARGEVELALAVLHVVPLKHGLQIGLRQAEQDLGRGQIEPDDNAKNMGLMFFFFLKRNILFSMEQS